MGLSVGWLRVFVAADGATSKDGGMRCMRFAARVTMSAIAYADAASHTLPCVCTHVRAQQPGGSAPWLRYNGHDSASVTGSKVAIQGGGFDLAAFVVAGINLSFITVMPSAGGAPAATQEPRACLWTLLPALSSSKQHSKVACVLFVLMAAAFPVEAAKGANVGACSSRLWLTQARSDCSAATHMLLSSSRLTKTNLCWWGTHVVVL